MHWLELIFTDFVTGVMNIEFLGTTFGSFCSMSLAEGFTYLCENMTIGTLLVLFIAFCVTRRFSRGLSNVLRPLAARLMAIGNSLQRDLFSQVNSPKTIFNPGTLGMKNETSTTSSTIETATELHANTSLAKFPPLV